MEESDKKRSRKRVDKKPSGSRNAKSTTSFRIDPDKVKAYKSRRTEIEKELGIEPKYAPKKPFADKGESGVRKETGFKKDTGFKRDGEFKKPGGFSKGDGFKKEGGFKREGTFKRADGFKKEGGFKREEGHSKTEGFNGGEGFKRADGFKKEGGFKREGEFKKEEGFNKEGGFAKDKGFRKVEGDFGKKKFDKAPGRFERGFPKKQEDRSSGGQSDLPSSEKKKRYAFDGGPTPEYRLRPPVRKKQPKLIQLKADDGTIRLNKYIADSGVCSRRDADGLIALGEIKVNGVAITEMGYKVKPTDVVKYGNRTLKREKNVYILMNKPKDFITTLDDPEDRKTVVDLLGKHVKERVYPVGRLDRNTTGLLLLTNDGELAEKLSHPSGKIKKIYEVELDAPLQKEDIDKLKKGVTLEDGPASVDALEVLTPNSKTIGLELHSGRNRIVRRLFEHIGHKVVKLDRVMYADLTKKDLPRGTWRHLSEKEVIRLKYFM